VGRLLTENLPYKVLSLVFAVAVWAWVQSDEVVEVRTRAQVHYDWPEGLVRARQVPKTLVVTVSGPQGVVRTIGSGQLSVDVDLSEAEQGNVPVDLTDLEIQGLPAGVEVVQVSPPAIDVELDRQLTREVEVRPTVIGEPAPGYRVVSVDASPATVHITGPQGTVKDIAQVSTDVIDLSGMRSDASVDATVILSDQVVALAPGAPGRVQIRVHMEPIIVERTFEEVPVMVRSAEGWTIDPPTARLTLSGPQEDVAALSLDKVAVVLQPPETMPRSGKVDLSWRKDHDDGEVEVVHDGPSEGIEVARMEPHRFLLVARK